MSIARDCNIRQMPGRVWYNPTQKAFITGMPALQGHEWDGSLARPPWAWGDRGTIDQLKKYVKESLEGIQEDICAFCGMRLYVTSAPQIEHIAPKGIGRYPQFMFHSCNLVLACSLCNGFEKKEKKEHFNTISRLDPVYENSYFNIVHPHLDDPVAHYSINRNGSSITISHLTLKGQKSIAVFKLDEEPLTTERGKVLFEKLYDFDSKFNNDFEAACQRRGY